MVLGLVSACLWGKPGLGASAGPLLGGAVSQDLWLQALGVPGLVRWSAGGGGPGCSPGDRGADAHPLVDEAGPGPSTGGQGHVPG